MRHKNNVLQKYWPLENLSKNHEDPPNSMYEEVDDSGRGERGMQRP